MTIIAPEAERGMLRGKRYTAATYLTQEDHDALRNAALRRDCSFSQILREACSTWIEDHPDLVSEIKPGELDVVEEPAVPDA